MSVEPREFASVPFRCHHCGANDWRVFEGDPTGEPGYVWVRLRCANPRCPKKGKYVVERRWSGGDDDRRLPRDAAG